MAAVIDEIADTVGDVVESVGNVVEDVGTLADNVVTVVSENPLLLVAAIAAPVALGAFAAEAGAVGALEVATAAEAVETGAAVLEATGTATAVASAEAAAATTVIEAGATVTEAATAATAVTGGATVAEAVTAATEGAVEASSIAEVATTAATEAGSTSAWETLSQGAQNITTKIGEMLVPGADAAIQKTIGQFALNTATNGGDLEKALKSTLIGAGTGAIGSTVADVTGSDIAGRVAANASSQLANTGDVNLTNIAGSELGRLAGNEVAGATGSDIAGRVADNATSQLVNTGDVNLTNIAGSELGRLAGNEVAGATGSNFLGNAAATTTSSLVSGQDPTNSLKNLAANTLINKGYDAATQTAIDLAKNVDQSPSGGALSQVKTQAENDVSQQDNAGTAPTDNSPTGGLNAVSAADQSQENQTPIVANPQPSGGGLNILSQMIKPMVTGAIKQQVMPQTPARVQARPLPPQKVSAAQLAQMQPIPNKAPAPTVNAAPAKTANVSGMTPITSIAKLTQLLKLKGKA